LSLGSSGCIIVRSSVFFPSLSATRASPSSAAARLRRRGSRRSQFLVMFKFFVQIAFHFEIHFHQFHLKVIPN
jgi:hypothetical protein